MVPYFPKLIAQKAVTCYVLSLAIVAAVFSSRAMPFYLYVFGIVSVVAFFYGSASWSKKEIRRRPLAFEKKLLLTAFLIRAVYVLFIYFFNNSRYGTFYESSAGDILWYYPTGLDIAEQIRNGHWGVLSDYMGWGVELSDMGYVVWLAAINLLTGNIGTVVIPLLIKALLGAYTCLLLYQLSNRHFGLEVAKMSGIFCALQPNMIWWCGSMMKETELVFLTVACINYMDLFLSQKRFTFKGISGAVLATCSLFCFRTVIGLMAFAALLVTLVFSDTRKVSASVKWVAGIAVAGLMLLSVGDTLLETAEGLLGNAGGDYQNVNMEWRTERKNGNEFAKYAGAAVFAPLIVTIPFPTMSYTFQEQELIMQASGGYFVKNIMSFFVILAFLKLLIEKKLRGHLLPITFVVGYLISLVLSVFAQSGRFHMPVIPFEMMFAAYGVSLLNRKNMQWVNYALVLECVICVGWNWFKLAGRGLA